MINILVFPGIWRYILLKKIKQSSLCGKLYVYTDEEKYLFDVEDIEVCKFETLNEYGKFVLENDINLIIVLDSKFARHGTVNFFKYNIGIPSIGITRYWLKLESSKKFAKEFMMVNNLRTPNYRIINNLNDLNNAILEFGVPMVIKYNGCLKGFGTYICNTKKECIKRAQQLLKENNFFIAEKYIKGKEVTLQVLWDGNSIIDFEPVRDYKRLRNNNEGINTGSMGCYIPAKISMNERQMINNYIKQLEDVFINIRPNFTGIFTLDLLFTEDEIYNLEFNMRPCTPEFEVFLEHINDYILKVFFNSALGYCKGLQFNYKSGITGCVNIMDKGFIKNIKSKKIKKIRLSDNFLITTDNIIINTDVPKPDKRGYIETRTDRRIFSVIKDDNIDPFFDIYKHIEKLNGKNWYFRTDIGAD